MRFLHESFLSALLSFCILIWVSIFSCGPRYVLVEGGALAKYTPEAYPEANPQNEDHF